MIATGLRAYGFEDDFARLRDGLLTAAPHFHAGSMPELFGGQREGPVPYPVSCRPQAWAAGALVALGL